MELTLCSILLIACFAHASGFILDTYHFSNYTCTFENNSCNYTSIASTNRRLHWNRQTISLITQPNTDHTLNTRGRGHVYNVKTSSVNIVGDKATLRSPLMTGLLGYTSIGFWYSISGSGNSAMNFSVTAKTPYSTIPLFTRLVHGIVHWTHVCVSPSFTGSLELIFEVKVLHSGVVGEIAIDDVTVFHGQSCSNMATSLPPVDLVSCNFDTSLCGYKNLRSPRDNFDWSRHKGSTVSTATGPTKDHTSGRGSYVYIETSSPRKPNEHALLESLSFSTNEVQHVSFWYHSYGASTGSLRVYLEHGTSLGAPVFQRSHSSINSWQHACITIPASRLTTHLVFEGVVGSSYQGDIAIDDVTLRSGDCNTQVTTTSRPGVAVNGHWGSWSSYSACSVTCGTGHVTSRRSCNNPAPSNGGHTCVGASSKQSICHQPSCPIDGKWQEWSGWSACSVTCGSGHRTSHRTCTNPAPQYGGHKCTGSSSRNATCVFSTCPVDGQWGSWGAWSACSVTCGSGHISSTRLCNNPAPSHGGHNCAGISDKEDTCQMTSCTVDGGWSDWTTWSKCTSSCDLGTITRDRSCSNPTPIGSGKHCSGDKTETHECSLGPCPTWSHWYQGECSSTCGNGTAERMRSCSTGNNADCGGISYTHVPCVGIECI